MLCAIISGLPGAFGVEGTVGMVFGILILLAITSIPAVIIGNRVLREIDAQPARYSGRARVKVGRILGWCVIALCGLLVVQLILMLTVG
jgi:hypothetical protein